MNSLRRLTVDLQARNLRSTSGVVGLTLLIIALISGLAWRTDFYLRQQAQDEALSHGREVLSAFGSHVTKLLNYGDSHLRAARVVYQRLGASDDLRDYLSAAKVPHGDSPVVATTFSDGEGRIVFDSELKDVPAVSAADLDYFRHLQARDEDIPYIDATRLGRVWKRYQFRIVRQMRRNGQFDGVGILNVKPEDLSNFTRQFDLGPNSVYSVLTLSDRKLIMRQPMAPNSAQEIPRGKRWV